MRSMIREWIWKVAGGCGCGRCWRRYGSLRERDTVGLLMVFAAQPFSFDEGDLAVVESLAHTWW